MKAYKFSAKDTHTKLDPERANVCRTNKVLDDINTVNQMKRRGFTDLEISDATGISRRSIHRRYYGYVDMHNLAPLNVLTNQPSWDGTRAKILKSDFKECYVHYDPKEFYYPYGYCRVVLGAKCDI